MEELAFLAGEGEDRDEGQHDDGHREEDGAAHETRGVEHRGGDGAAVTQVHPPLLDEAEGVLRDDDGRVDEDADGDGDAGQRHDIGGDAEVAHEEKGDQHGERDRDRDDQDRSYVEEEEDIHEGNHDRLLDQRPLEGGDGALDQGRAVVEGDDAHP